MKYECLYETTEARDRAKIWDSNIRKTLTAIDNGKVDTVAFCTEWPDFFKKVRIEQNLMEDISVEDRIMHYTEIRMEKTELEDEILKHLHHRKILENKLNFLKEKILVFCGAGCEPIIPLGSEFYTYKDKDYVDKQKFLRHFIHKVMTEEPNPVILKLLEFSEKGYINIVTTNISKSFQQGFKKYGPQRITELRNNRIEYREDERLVKVTLMIKEPEAIGEYVELAKNCPLALYMGTSMSNDDFVPTAYSYFNEQRTIKGLKSGPGYPEIIRIVKPIKKSVFKKEIRLRQKLSNMHDDIEAVRDHNAVLRKIGWIYPSTLADLDLPVLKMIGDLNYIIPGISDTGVPTSLS